MIVAPRLGGTAADGGTAVGVAGGQDSTMVAKEEEGVVLVVEVVWVMGVVKGVPLV